MSQEPTTTKSVEQGGNKRSNGSPWRYRCPNGHASWVRLVTANEYKCKSCGIRFPEEELVDLREESRES